MVSISKQQIQITVIDEVAEGDYYITFEIGHDGKFDFDAELTFDVDNKYADKTATLYYDNNGTLEKVGSYKVAADGTVKYAFAHASDYVLVVEDTAVEETTTGSGSGTGETTGSGAGAGATSPNTGDGSMVGILLALAAISAIVVLKKKTVVE